MGERAKRKLERQQYDPYDPKCQHNAVTAKEALTSFMNNKLASNLSLTHTAFLKWCEAAGKRAANHTMAVWVNEKKSPVELVVYIDNSSLIVDYTTNAELYIDRLAYIGFPVSGLKFRLSNKTKSPNTDVVQQNKKLSVNNLPELSEEEKTFIKSECEKLPSEYRENVSKAMELSFRYQKLENTSNTKTNA